MAKGASPDQMAQYFFKSLMHNQCHVCWGLFSQRTQTEFLNWTLQDIYQRHPQAAQASKLAMPEVKMLFENNDPGVMKSFWKRFFYSSGTNDFFQFGTYHTVQSDNKNATVRIQLEYPNGHRTAVDIQMVFEKGGWKLAYVEAGLPF
jgi:hypothetical protein